MGRRPFQPTDAQRGEVKLLAAYGIPHEDIAERLGIDPKTLRKHFARELRAGVTDANARVAQRLYKKACDGDLTAIIWWEKTRANKSDKVRTELTGADGGAVRIDVDVTQLSDDELAAIVNGPAAKGRG